MDTEDPATAAAFPEARFYPFWIRSRDARGFGGHPGRRAAVREYQA